MPTRSENFSTAESLLVIDAAITFESYRDSLNGRGKAIFYSKDERADAMFEYYVKLCSDQNVQSVRTAKSVATHYNNLVQKFKSICDYNRQSGVIYYEDLSEALRKEKKLPVLVPELLSRLNQTIGGNQAYNPSLLLDNSKPITSKRDSDEDSTGRPTKSTKLDPLLMFLQRNAEKKEKIAERELVVQSQMAQAFQEIAKALSVSNVPQPPPEPAVVPPPPPLPHLKPYLLQIDWRKRWLLLWLLCEKSTVICCFVLLFALALVSTSSATRTRLHSRECCAVTLELLFQYIWIETR